LDALKEVIEDLLEIVMSRTWKWVFGVKFAYVKTFNGLLVRQSMFQGENLEFYQSSES